MRTAGRAEGWCSEWPRACRFHLLSIRLLAHSSGVVFLFVTAYLGSWSGLPAVGSVPLTLHGACFNNVPQKIVELPAIIE